MLIRKKFRFEAAHRLIDAPSVRCRGIHGHSYVVEVYVGGRMNIATGMVVDFGDLKRTIGTFIDRFDHAMIIAADDPLTEHVAILSSLNPRFIITPYPPTAELMAAHFYHEAARRLESMCPASQIAAVRVHETETGWAECRRNYGLEIPFDQTSYSEKTDAIA